MPDWDDDLDTKKKGGIDEVEEGAEDADGDDFDMGDTDEDA